MPISREYRLHGPQVEPTSSFWLDSPAIRVPRLGEVQAYAESGENPRLHLSPDLFPDDDALEREFAFIKVLESRRINAPYQIVTFDQGTPPGDFRQLTELSRFIHLKDPPFGAIFDTVERPQINFSTINNQQLRILLNSRVVNEGRELARMFEEETPGIYHRHALNWLLFLRPDISPTRQARIWMGLDIAIYTALSAAWYYKWRDERYRRLLRPSEYATRTGADLTVLFDEVVNFQGHDEGQNVRRECPRRPPGSEAYHPDSPGTPRHPAWTSGHSTYSAAATYMLEYFFSPDTLSVSDEVIFGEFPANQQITKETLINPRWIAAELRRLANNIGEARLWGGVHWVSDHVAGQRVGRSAAQAVIDTFLEDVICPFMAPMCDNANLPAPPTPDELDAQWTECTQNPDPAQDAVPQPENPDREKAAREFGIF
jgi:membrane-associated phospholipid phosphatase